MISKIDNYKKILKLVYYFIQHILQIFLIVFLILIYFAFIMDFTRESERIFRKDEFFTNQEPINFFRFFFLEIISQFKNLSKT